VPAKFRSPKDRRPVFSATALELFRQLEAEPKGRRNGPLFQAKARQLARELNLAREWWTGCSVLDRSSGPIHASPEYAEHHDWHRCRAVREQLLESIRAH